MQSVESKYTAVVPKCILCLARERERVQELVPARVPGNRSQESHRDLPGFAHKDRKTQQLAKHAGLVLHLAMLDRFLRIQSERDH